MYCLVTNTHKFKYVLVTDFGFKTVHHFKRVDITVYNPKNPIK